MLTQPTIVEKADQPFAAILLTAEPARNRQCRAAVDRRRDRLGQGQGGQLTGPPFFNYVGFYPGGTMDMQVGMPTATCCRPKVGLPPARCPAGRYASITATVPYHELHDANMKLDSWVKDQHLDLDGREEGDRWVGANRMEIYHKDPGRRSVRASGDRDRLQVDGLAVPGVPVAEMRSAAARRSS